MNWLKAKDICIRLSSLLGLCRICRCMFFFQPTSGALRALPLPRCHEGGTFTTDEAALSGAVLPSEGMSSTLLAPTPHTFSEGTWSPRVSEKDTHTSTWLDLGVTWLEARPSPQTDQGPPARTPREDRQVQVAGHFADQQFRRSGSGAAAAVEEIDRFNGTTHVG